MSIKLLRLKQVLELVPVSKSTWYAGMKSGRYPAKVPYLGPRISAWKLDDVIKLINGEATDHE